MDDSGLTEGIRCALCTNPMANDMGCDGGCMVNEYQLKKIIDVIEQARIKEQEPKIAYWIDTGSGQECSECREIQYGYDNFRHFCANCGAKIVKPPKRELENPFNDSRFGG